MNPLFFVETLSKGLKAMVFLATYWPIINVIFTCCGMVYVYNYIKALMETPVWYLSWYLYAMFNMNFDSCIPDGMANFTSNYIPNGIADFTNHTVFKPVSKFSFWFIKHFSNAELTQMLVNVTGVAALFISVFLNLFLYRTIRTMIKQKESPPNPENTDWQGIWRDLGEILEEWGPTMSWDFTLEHLWHPQKLSQYLRQGQCGLGKSKEVQLIWGLACAYRALYNTILEREFLS